MLARKVWDENLAARPAHGPPRDKPLRLRGVQIERERPSRRLRFIPDAVHIRSPGQVPFSFTVTSYKMLSLLTFVVVWPLPC